MRTEYGLEYDGPDGRLTSWWHDLNKSQLANLIAEDLEDFGYTSYPNAVIVRREVTEGVPA